MPSVLSESLHPAKFTPKYVGLARDLLRDIERRALSPGDRLATEGELVERFGLSRVTVRQALELLEKEGYISRERARGTFVKKQVASLEHAGLIRGTILIVCSNEQRSHRAEDPAFATILFAIEQALAKEGFTIQIASIGQNAGDDRQRLLGLAARGGLEGILTIGPYLEPFRELFGDIPVVTSCTFNTGALPWIGDDVALASFESVRHLLDHGHRDIALIAGPWLDGADFAVFARGYRQAYEAAELKPNRSLMLHAYPGESLEDIATEVLSGDTRPTAVFCENWRVCRAILSAAARAGLRVSQDLSIVGYGQNVLAIEEPVHLTAFVPKTDEIGHAAAHLLISMIGGAEPPGEPTLIAGHLVARDSVRRIGT